LILLTVFDSLGADALRLTARCTPRCFDPLASLDARAGVLVDEGRRVLGRAIYDRAHSGDPARKNELVARQEHFTPELALLGEQKTAKIIPLLEEPTCGAETIKKHTAG
jgi:hypothetical protein